MPTSNKTHRALSTLNLPRNVSALVNYAIGINKAVTGNANFPNPPPQLATLPKAIDDLQTAETTAKSRASGAVAARNEKRGTLVTLLEEVRTYVQSTADASPENGPSIIQSAGLALRKTPVRPPLGFHVKPGGVSGAVKIVAPAAARRASYEWQYSTDGGKTWIAMPSTLKSRTTLSGLTPATTVVFRYRAITKTGEGDWSQPISQLVS